MPIEYLDFGLRVHTGLRQNLINTIGELASAGREQLSDIRGIGEVWLDIIEQRLNVLGYTLAE